MGPIKFFSAVCLSVCNAFLKLPHPPAKRRGRRPSLTKCVATIDLDPKISKISCDPPPPPRPKNFFQKILAPPHPHPTSSKIFLKIFKFFSTPHTTSKIFPKILTTSQKNHKNFISIFTYEYSRIYGDAGSCEYFCSFADCRLLLVLLLISISM